MSNFLNIKSVSEEQENCKSNQKQTINNLSPEKYGKAAYFGATYTPSKLAENHLYRDASTMKKMEVSNAKIRQIEATNSILTDRISQMKQQKQGIEQSLISQISMYKKMLQQSQKKKENRAKQTQQTIKRQINKIVEEKEQQVKFMQSEKQILQNRIQQLQTIINGLKNQIQQHKSEFESLKNEKQKIDIKYDNVCEKLIESQKKIQNNSMQAEQKYNSLCKQIDSLNKFHQIQLQKLSSQKQAQNLRVQQQIKSLTQNFQKQINSLQQLINDNNAVIEKSQRQAELKQNQIQNLNTEKNSLSQQIIQLNKDNGLIVKNIESIKTSFNVERAELNDLICSLKEELEISRLNGYFQENQILTREVRNLRNLLFESSNEMEKCSFKLIQLGKEKQHLMHCLKELGIQNQMLKRMKNSCESELRKW